jgi:polysaccharide deacetylase family protein (PEP-CTERM system associated)
MLPPSHFDRRFPDARRGASWRGPGGRTNLLTVSLEDYYHAGAFGKLIPRNQWYRFESRIEQSTMRTLDLLDEFGISATVFVLGCVAELYPELVRTVRERGHEIASKGYQHRPIGEMSRVELAEDLQRAREAIERACGQRIAGCRVSDWLTPRDAWALDVMAEQGYLYDSSMRPMLRSHADDPASRRAHLHRTGESSIWEFPVSSVSLLGLDIPVAGGNWFRQLPHGLVRRGIARAHRDESSPMVLYFQSWELDPEQPRIEAASAWTRLRHYRNLDRMPEILRHYFARYSFTGISEWLAVPTIDVHPARGAGPLRVITGARSPALVPPARSLPRLAVSVVIPCYNEERALPSLANMLRRLEDSLGAAYDLRFFFVDDGSTDGTPAALRMHFRDWANVIVLRHGQNRGVTAAIHTGMLAANTESGCSMGCDCGYDPHELARMIPRLRTGVDLVVASPYHPDGAVRNLPMWRLALSRSLARMYRLVLRHKLHTYTSVFGVYRRSRLLAVSARRAGFIGITETLARLDLTGAEIVEHPVTLEARIFGRSKLKLARAVVGHLGLLAELAWRRVRGSDDAHHRRDAQLNDEAALDRVAR